MTSHDRPWAGAGMPRPDRGCVPERYRSRMDDLFDTWASVRSRNAALSAYYDMKNALRDLGISIPEGLLRVNCAVGWCKKAVDARAVRSVFDGFAAGGEDNPRLSALVRENRMRTLYNQACRSMLVHGVSAITVMRGGWGQPDAVVRAYSANQFCCLWDKDAGRPSCGVVCAAVDAVGAATRYVAHFPEAVLVFERDQASGAWSLASEEPNPMGRPLMEVLRFDPDLDRPLGHSLITPELQGIVDKAMRDVMRMEVGAEFFTFPQRYILGATDALFSEPPEGCSQADDGSWVDSEGNEVRPVPSEVKKMRAYVGAFLAISRDENGELPEVGQFSPGSADNFTRVFENDAQRFSGATNVPLAQLGVLSNTYTSSDALGAANDPLILAVEEMNRENGEAMEEVARMMLAVADGVPMYALTDEERAVQALWKDPSMPTLAARADGWTQLGQADKSIIGTRVWYEMLGLPQATIDRLVAEKGTVSVSDALIGLAEAIKPKPLPAAEGAE